jgi:hypothetical protein
MAKEQQDASEGRKESPSLLGRIWDNTKAVGRGALALPAHAVNNPIDTAVKATMLGLASIPVFGSIVTAAYTMKRARHNNDSRGWAFAKGMFAGAVSLVPVVGSVIGAAIVAGHALKNIDQQTKANGGINKVKTEARARRQKAGEAIRGITLSKVKEFAKSLGKAETWVQAAKATPKLIIGAVTEARKLWGKSQRQIAEEQKASTQPVVSIPVGVLIPASSQNSEQVKQAFIEASSTGSLRGSAVKPPPPTPKISPASGKGIGIEKILNKMAGSFTRL